jgi:hypothetical protein
MSPKINYRPSDDIKSAIEGAKLGWVSIPDDDEEDENSDTPSNGDNNGGGFRSRRKHFRITYSV